MFIRNRHATGFTIVELLIVIVVIGILAAVTIIGFNGVQRSAGVSTLKNDLSQLQRTLEIYKTDNNDQYPDPSIADGLLGVSDDTSLEYSADGDTYCATVSSDIARTSFYVDSTGATITEGVCPGSDHVGYVGGPAVEPGPWTDISLAWAHNCGIADAQVYCWGSGSNGKLGSGLTSRSQPHPVSTTGVLAGLNVTMIATPSSGSHTCALADNNVYCWGINSYGRLGDGTTTQRNTPVAVVDSNGVLAGKTISKIALGGVHSCVIADGAPYCWGRNHRGQLGTGTSTAEERNPVATDVTGELAGKVVTDITMGDDTTCAIADGAAYCWGYRAYGQLGTGQTSGIQLSPAPVSTSGVLNGKTIAKISSGSQYTCVVTTDGGVYCWGLTSGGVLGNGVSGFDNEPLPVAASNGGVLDSLTATDITASYRHTCAVTTEGMYCWGGGGRGLGNGTTDEQLVPTPVNGEGTLDGRTIQKISAGFQNTCVLATGQVFCTGTNTFGTIGDGVIENRTLYVPVINP